MSDTYRPTRYAELGYVCDGPALWRIVDVCGGLNASGFWPRIGPQYGSRAELLADLGRYALAYGCTGDMP